MALSAAAGQRGFRHELLLHRSTQELLEFVVPMVREGVAAEELTDAAPGPRGHCRVRAAPGRALALENLQNTAAVAGAVQVALIPLRRAARRRRWSASDAVEGVVRSAPAWATSTRWRSGMDEHVSVVTRRSLHAGAAGVLVGSRYRAEGTIRLQVTPGGFGPAPGASRVEETASSARALDAYINWP
jgi:hypothetical protein